MPKEVVKLPKHRNGTTMMGHIFDNWEGSDVLYETHGGTLYEPIVEDGEFHSLMPYRSIEEYKIKNDE